MNKWMIGFLTLLLVVIMLSGQGNVQASANPVKDKAQALAQTVISDYGVTSLQYAIRDHGAITLSDGAGASNLEIGAPVTRETMYGIGSVSKMVVAAATMQLVDAKLVDLDQPLTTYIKNFQMADKRYRQITPRMLLNHSSGLYGSHYENSMLFDDNDTQNHDELLSKLRSEHLKSDPGAYSVYCNDGFTLLEILVERVSGVSYSDYLDQHFNKPLGLGSTKTPLDTFDREKLAKTYFPGIDHVLPVENANVLGAGGIYSTAEELTKFAEVLMGDRPDLLSQAAAKSMQNYEYRNGIWVEEETNIFNYGLGWDAVKLAPFGDYGLTALSKGGDTIVYHAGMIVLPEQHISIAVLSSGGSSFYNSAFAAAVLLEYIHDKGLIDDIQPAPAFESPVKVEMPSELQVYSGMYGFVGETMKVDIRQGQVELAAQMSGLIPAQTYVYTGDGKFTNSDGSASVSFVKETNGKTYLKLDAYLSFPGLAQMRMVSYEYQKLEAQPLSQKVKETWRTRNGKTYYALDEKINSLFYMSTAVLNKTISVDLEHGYANAAKIVDANQAVNVMEIPNMNSRDAFDLKFSERKGAEYLTVNGQTFIREDAIPSVYAGSHSTLTIQPGGQARWYAIDSSTGGRTMSVEARESGGFVVYDEQGAIVHSSIISQTPAFKLPAGGKIVFGGQPGDVFRIHLSQ
ncbi:serine hydrolase domain-containing protein [Paenibacillus timonensis]|uniref:serine hydrolase domain-containing protein n=1 Tax=Paenibacillus timonensis TaxID=225915 RepID=UPI003F9571C9